MIVSHKNFLSKILCMVCAVVLVTPFVSQAMENNGNGNGDKNERPSKRIRVEEPNEVSLGTWEIEIPRAGSREYVTPKQLSDALAHAAISLSRSRASSQEESPFTPEQQRVIDRFFSTLPTREQLRVIDSFVRLMPDYSSSR